MNRCMKTALKSFLEVMNRAFCGALEAAPFLSKLTGGGRVGGQRWRLVYLANRNAVVAKRKGEAAALLLGPRLVRGRPG